VLMDRWDVMPGGMVLLHRDLGAKSGRWLVHTVSGNSLDSPEGQILLRRPTARKKEPAPELVSDQTTTGATKTVSKLRTVCRSMSGARATYLYGGGHGPPVKKLKESQHLDCSSSVSLALYKAGFFDGDKPAFVSGKFATDWGQPGKGDEFTVYAHGGHVFIEFANGDRFDTSQHSGKSGPAYTTVKRSHAGFTARHARGH
jgi:hypothetical protein